MSTIDIKDKEKTGFIFAVLDTITYGLFPVFAHYFVATMDPLLFGGVATLIGSLPLLAILKKRNKESEVYSSEFFKPLLQIAFLTTIANIFFFLGTKITSGINTGLLVQLEPFYAMILGIVLLKETMHKKQFAATFLMVVGAVIVVYKGVNNLNVGDIFILVTPIFYQLSHIISKRIINKVSDIYTIPAARMLYGGIALTTFALVLNPLSLSQLFNINNILALIFFGFIFRALDFTLWYEAIKRIPISKAAAVLPFAAAVSFFCSILFLNEKATFQQYTGLLLIMGGLLWLSFMQFKVKKKSH